MKDQIKIRYNVKITPDKMNPKIKETIKQICEDKLVGFCHKDYGYVSEIIDIVDTGVGMVIGDDCSVSFPLVLKIEVITCKEGDILTGEINKATAMGCFIHMGSIMIIVTPDFIHDGSYVYKDNYFVNKKGKKLRTGDTVSISIIEVKLDKNSIKCVGKIV